MLKLGASDVDADHHLHRDRARFDLNGFNQTAVDPAVLTNTGGTQSVFTINSQTSGLAGFNGVISGNVVIVFNSNTAGANGWNLNGRQHLHRRDDHQQRRIGITAPTTISAASGAC